MVYGLTQSNPVGGDHGDLIVALARFLRPQTYLELGVAEGATYRKVAMAVAEWGGTSVGIDHSLTLEKMADLPGQCIATDTVAYLKTCPPGSVEFIFLDSSHEYEATLKEIVLILDALTPNGVLLMHDTYPPNEEQMASGRCGDVWRMAAELKDFVAFESMTLPAQYGLTLVRRNGGKQLLWKA